MVLDTPAGLHAKRLDEVMKLADTNGVPLQPSIFDSHATHDFMRQIRARKHMNKHAHKVQIGIVGMNLPVSGWLRDTQNYIHLAARGLTLWDVAPSRVERDLEQ